MSTSDPNQTAAPNSSAAATSARIVLPTNVQMPPSRLMVLMFTDIVGSVDLKNRIGTGEYAAALAKHDQLFKRLVLLSPGAEILTDTGDGFFACFASSADAVRTALLFQSELARVARPLHVRVGLHVGEVTHVNSGGVESRPKVIGLAADLASRITHLAGADQILLSRFPFNEARQFVRAHPPLDDGSTPEVRWVAHGEYVFKGSDEPMDVFEVGTPNLAPLAPPSDNDDARRAVRPGDELTLGWRPAGGLEMPTRAQWVIKEKLGEGGFGEVWLAEHSKTRMRRVFKFCFDSQRLRALKREVILFRLLKDALGDRRDIARVTDYQFDESPYFIEYEYVPGGALQKWAASIGGIQNAPREQRIYIVKKVAEALAAAHSVGVIHKDVKPSNILVANHEAADALYPVLTDFGIGLLTDVTQLHKRDITELGFTRSAMTENDSSRTGTRIYAPPETLVNQKFTIQGDIYALGVLLYQMVVGDFERPIAEGWERDVDDELIREDIAACVQGDPSRRLASAAELANRLERLDQRRVELRRERSAKAAAVRRRTALQICAALMLIAIAMAAFLWMNKKKVEREAARADAVQTFLRDMLVSVDPAQANKRDIKVIDVLDRAAKKLDDPSTAPKQAGVENVLRATLGRTYLTLGLYPAAEQQMSKAVEIGRAEGVNDRAMLKQLSDLGIVYLYTARFPEAEKTFKEALDRRIKLFGEDDPETADSLYNLQLVAGQTHRYDDAESYGRRALAIREKRFGHQSKEVAASLQYLGLFALDANRAADAEPLLVESLDIRRKVLPENHFEIGNAETNLGLFYLRANDFEKAQKHFELARSIFTVALPPDHPNHAQVLSNLAGVFIRQNDFDHAAPYAEQAVALQEKVLPPDHPDLALALHGLGVVQYSRKDYAKAEQAMARAHSIFAKKLGNDHPYTQNTKMTLGLIQRDGKKYDESFKVLREVTEDFRRVKSDNQAAQCDVSLFEGLIWAERFDEAEKQGAISFTNASRLSDPVGRQKLVGDTLTLYVQLYEAWKKPEQAEDYKRRVERYMHPEQSAEPIPSTQPQQAK